MPHSSVRPGSYWFGSVRFGSARFCIHSCSLSACQPICVLNMYNCTYIGPLHQRFIQLILLFYRYNNYNKSTNIYYIFHIMENTFYYEFRICIRIHTNANNPPHSYIIIWPLTISFCSLYVTIQDRSVTRFIHLVFSIFFSFFLFLFLTLTISH